MSKMRSKCKNAKMLIKQMQMTLDQFCEPAQYVINFRIRNGPPGDDGFCEEAVTTKGYPTAQMIEEGMREACRGYSHVRNVHYDIIEPKMSFPGLLEPK